MPKPTDTRPTDPTPADAAAHEDRNTPAHPDTQSERAVHSDPRNPERDPRQPFNPERGTRSPEVATADPRRTTLPHDPVPDPARPPAVAPTIKERAAEPKLTVEQIAEFADKVDQDFCALSGCADRSDRSDRPDRRPLTPAEVTAETARLGRALTPDERAGVLDTRATSTARPSRREPHPGTTVARINQRLLNPGSGPAGLTAAEFQRLPYAEQARAKLFLGVVDALKGML